MGLWLTLSQPYFSLWNYAFPCCLIELSSTAGDRSLLMLSGLARRRGSLLGVLQLWHQNAEHQRARSVSNVHCTLRGRLWAGVPGPYLRGGKDVWKQDWYVGWLSARKETSDHLQRLVLSTLLALRTYHPCLLSSLMVFRRFPLAQQSCEEKTPLVTIVPLSFGELGVFINPVKANWKNACFFPFCICHLKDWEC